jgi:hypothetical protein
MELDDTAALLRLPIELTTHILEQVAPNLCDAAMTCRLFRLVCEDIAERAFRAKFGTNKPRDASWCRCLCVAATHFAPQRTGLHPVPHHVLFYGLSNPGLLWGLTMNFDGAGTPYTMYRFLSHLGLRDTINDLFMPLMIQTDCVTRALLLAIMEAKDHHNFDLLTLNPPDALKKTFPMFAFSKFAHHLEDPLLPLLFSRLATTNSEQRGVIKRASRSCITMRHIELLKLVLSIYGPAVTPATRDLWGIWSSSMVYDAKKCRGEGVVNAYIDFWLQHCPDLVTLKVGFHDEPFYWVFGTHKPWVHCTSFLVNHEHVRLHEVPLDDAVEWWRICTKCVTTMDEVMYNEDAAIKLFDLFRQRGLRLGCGVGDLGWILYEGILKPLLQFFGAHQPKFELASPRFFRHVIASVQASWVHRPIDPRVLNANRVIHSYHIIREQNLLKSGAFVEAEDAIND